ncbi:MAG: polyprenyl synthetase family protein [Candidatus Methylacidiphilales bacterium]
MSFSPEAQERTQQLLEHYIQDFFQENKERYHYGEWFEPIYFDLCEYVGRKGKRIRPLLLISSYKALGGERSVQDTSLLRSALALELLHTFILMHDDVIDRSDIRRGQPTFHKLAQRRLEPFASSIRHGESLAIVLGDMVFTMAMEALLETDFPAETRLRLQQMMLRCAADTGAGEMQDILLGTRDISRVQADEIQHMYHLKTTRYTFETPCVMGAVLAGASADKVEALIRFVHSLGLAFQIDNDLLEFRYLDKDLVGFPADLLEGKKTLLVQEAYESLNEVDRSFLQMCLGSERKSEATLIKIYDLIRKSGALDRLAQHARRLFAQAEQELSSGAFTESEENALRMAVQGIKSQIKVAV